MPLSDVYGTQTGGPGLSYGLDGITDWSPGQAFLNVFKTARAWVGHEPGQWGGINYQQMQDDGLLDEEGYLTRMPDGADKVETFVLTELPAEASYTAGRYRLTYEGEGDLEVGGSATNIVYSDGEVWFDYEPNGEGLVTIGFTSTDPLETGDYLRNFELVKEDNIAAYEAGEIFNPLWLDNLDEAHALRFMDWMQTNNSVVETWEDRPEVGDFTWAMGVPVEIMVALANQTGTEPWFNIPHDADEAFITAFAEYVRDNLDPELRAHFEFSNEVWNFMFEQARDSALEAGERFEEDLPDGWMQEYGASAAEMAKILDMVYAGREERLVKVIATHTGWPGLEESILDAPAYVALDPENDAPYTLFHTYAITGYFGASLGHEKAETVLEWIAASRADAEARADNLGLTGEGRATWISEHQYDLATGLAIQELRDGSVTGDVSGSLAELFNLFTYHAGVAETYGLDLVMYEGGTHVVAGGDFTGNSILTDFFIHLNYSEGMGQLYSELLAGWVDAGGTLFNAFVDVAGASQWGSWGSLRYLGDENARDDALDAFADDYPRLDLGGTIIDEVEGAGPGNQDIEGALLEGTADDDLILHDWEGRTSHGDTIRGGSGNDILYDGQGSDTIDGGEGYDLISLWEDGDTLDVVENFDPGSDMLDLSPQGIYALSQLIIAQVGDSSDLMIDFAGDRVILLGMWDIETGTHMLTEDNLLLAAPPEGAEENPAAEPYTGPMPADQPEGEDASQPEGPADPETPDAGDTDGPSPIPEVGEVREYIFGHSLINHASDTPATAVPWWVDAFADADPDANYAFAGQYGFLPQHDDLPPSSNWGYDGIDSAWDSDTGESFASADFTHVTITAGNFIQWQGPDHAYWNDPNTTPISATLDIIDFVTAQEPGVTILIYENWPDMGGYISSWPPTRGEFDAWCDYLRGDFHSWWTDYTSALQEARPDVTIRMVPVGPVLADLLQSSELGLDDIPLELLFSDDAPHGTPSLYFLASIIHYAALYGKLPGSDFAISGEVHPDIISSFPAILDLVAERMELGVEAGTEPDETPTPDPVEPQDPEDPDEPDQPVDPDEEPETGPEELPDQDPNCEDAPNVDWSDPGNYSQLIEGGKGDDRLKGTDGDDFVFAGAGKDLIYGSDGIDHIDGGDGYDRVQYQDHDADIVIDMNDPWAGTHSAHGDSFASIERIQSGNGNDTLRLADDVRGDGGGGNDVIIDAAGKEEMHGGEGEDTFVFQARDGHQDRIIDFQSGVDLIDLTGWETSWDEVAVWGDSKGRAYVEVNGDSLRIDNAWNSETKEANFSVDDFIF